MCFVLNEAAITNFSMSPETLDDVKHMFHLRAHTALPPIPLAIPGAQRSVSITSSLYAPADAGRFILLLPLAAHIGAIAINGGFVAMKQIAHEMRVMNARSADRGAVRQAAGTIDAYMQLHPKIPFLALSHAAHLRIAAAT